MTVGPLKREHFERPTTRLFPFSAVQLALAAYFFGELAEAMRKRQANSCRLKVSRFCIDSEPVWSARSSQGPDRCRVFQGRSNGSLPPA